jgi:hypothetical protein
MIKYIGIEVQSAPASMTDDREDEVILSYYAKDNQVTIDAYGAAMSINAEDLLNGLRELGFLIAASEKTKGVK